LFAIFAVLRGKVTSVGTLFAIFAISRSIAMTQNTKQPNQTSKQDSTTATRPDASEDRIQPQVKYRDRPTDDGKHGDEAQEPVRRD
jgi:hypothetical protein